MPITLLIVEGPEFFTLFEDYFEQGFPGFHKETKFGLLRFLDVDTDEASQLDQQRQLLSDFNLYYLTEGSIPLTIDYIPLQISTDEMDNHEKYRCARLQTHLNQIKQDLLFG